MNAPAEGIIVACCDKPNGKRLLRSEKCECQDRRREFKRQLNEKSGASIGENKSSTSAGMPKFPVDIENDPNWTLVERFERQVYEETYNVPKGGGTHSLEDDEDFFGNWEELFQRGDLKDTLDSLGFEESRRRLRQFFESLPMCRDCGEKHPSVTPDKLLSIQKKPKTGAPVKSLAPPSKGCQWPNPCKADCLEDHDKARQVRLKVQK